MKTMVTKIFMVILVHTDDIIFFAFSTCFLPLFTVVESAIMASIKIKEPG